MSQEYLGDCWRDSLYALPKEQERELFDKAAQDDETAISELFERHLGLVAYIVHDFHSANGNTPQLMEAGVDTLERSIKSFGTLNGQRFVDHLCEQLGSLVVPRERTAVVRIAGHVSYTPDRQLQEERDRIFQKLESNPDF